MIEHFVNLTVAENDECRPVRQMNTLPGICVLWECCVFSEGVNAEWEVDQDQACRECKESDEARFSHA